MKKLMVGGEMDTCVLLATPGAAGILSLVFLLRSELRDWVSKLGTERLWARTRRDHGE